MKGVSLEYKKPVESVDTKKIILDVEGRYPREVIFLDSQGHERRYRLVKTKFCKFALNR